jgi:hypothetical protein
VAIALMPVAACGGGNDDEERSAEGPPATAGASTSVGATSSSDISVVDTDPATTTAPRITEEDLRTVLISLEELPTGWSESAEESEDVEICGYGSLSDELETVAFVDADYEDPTGSELLPEGLAVFADGPEAGMALARDRLSCPSFDGGELGEITISPASFPNVGDDSFAVRLSAQVESIDVTIFQVFWSHGPIVAGIQHGGLFADVTQLEEYVQTLDDRIADFLASWHLLALDRGDRRRKPTSPCPPHPQCSQMRGAQSVSSIRD